MKASISGKVTARGAVAGRVRSEAGISGKVERPETVYVRELRFSNHYEFPSIGDSECLYIAIDENATYRYDDQDRAYYCVGRDYKQIQAIQIKLKE